MIDKKDTTNMNKLPTYQLIKPISSDVVGAFVKQYANFSDIVGYSALGHIFLRSPSSDEYLVFYPFRQAGKAYGVFDGVEEFDKQVLQEESFDLFVLKSDFVEELVKAHGELADGEVFIPEPYFEHDSEEVSKFGKGNVLVMLDLVNQFFNAD